ncbi:MAG: hypothetical protein ACI89D_000506, partial [Bermanella sp.]
HNLLLGVSKSGNRKVPPAIPLVGGRFQRNVLEQLGVKSQYL